ncbi:TPA: hypothetical protein ACOJPN_005132 [Vibrio harveyi]|uniref:hypothetical protein n=1 Tax=Vibrio harveyi TaxID=669 RepID=UPI00390BE6C7
MSKIHTKNGFHYKHTKSCYGGVWSHTWYIKPVESEIFLGYTNTDTFKTLKADVENFLSNPQKAREYYFADLARKSDVELALKQLADAEARYERVHSPDFDIKGNNPNAETRARRNAESQLFSARAALEQAQRFKAILGNAPSRESEC